MASEYVYQPAAVVPAFSAACAILAQKRPGNPTRKGSVPATDLSELLNIETEFRRLGMNVQHLNLDESAYWRHMESAGYATRYPTYYEGNLTEKSTEHFLAMQFLKLGPGGVFIDLASEHSPLAEIASRVTGCAAYSQDITYPAGVHGNRIGGDACGMPVPDGFATAAALTCSLEHFEGDGDTRLFAELARVLRPGGKVASVPLYLFSESATQTDPTISAGLDIPWDDGVVIYCTEGWGNRHGRFYSPETLLDRLIRPHTKAFDFGVYRVHSVDPQVYCRWALVAQRK